MSVPDNIVPDSINTTSDTATNASKRRSILDERAKLLAQAHADDELQATLDILVFAAAGVRLGVMIDTVSRTEQITHLTPIPSAPPYLVGLTIMEGRLVSLLDVISFLNISHQGASDITAGVLVTNGKRWLALAAEKLLGVAEIPTKNLRDVPGEQRPIHHFAHFGDNDVSILDIKQLLADPRLGQSS